MKNVVQVIKFGAKMAVAAAAVVLAVGVMKGTAYADDGKPTSGSDEGIAWSYNNGTLTINPSPTAADEKKGTMSSYTASPVTGGEGAPGWSVWYSEVTDIVIGDGVKNISNNAFGGTSNSVKELKSVEIGEDVATISGSAFTFAKIGTLTVYSTQIDNADDIPDTAFMSTKTDNGSTVAYLSVSEVNTKNAIVKDYFKRFTDNNKSVNIGGSSNVSVIKSNVKINPFVVWFVDGNVLDTGAKAYYKGDYDDDFTEVTKKEQNILSETFWNVYRGFEANNYVVSRLKLFDISSSNPMVTTETAQIKIPVPSEWKDHADTIKVLTYETANSSVEIKDVSSTVDGDYIVFTAPHFSAYALYYTYDESSSEEPPAPEDPDTGKEVTLKIDSNYFNYYAYQLGTNSADIKVAGTNDTSTAAVTDAFSQFYSANEINNSGYKIDADHLKAFNLTAYLDGVETSNKIENLSIWVPVPAAWASNAANVLILTVTDGKIEVVNKIDVRTNNGSVEFRFAPPHFSPYAVYYADAEVTTAAATTTVAATTTAAATTKATTTAAPTTKASSGGSNTNSGSGKLDYTPGTGVKDFMWIAVPIAVLLMGVGVVVLAMRKRKNLDE
jgi:hypothetical protein